MNIATTDSQKSEESQGVRAVSRYKVPNEPYDSSAEAMAVYRDPSTGQESILFSTLLSHQIWQYTPNTKSAVPWCGRGKETSKTHCPHVKADDDDDDKAPKGTCCGLFCGGCCDGPLVEAGLTRPSGISVDAKTGAVYVCDCSTVRHVDPAKNVTRTVAGSHVLGHRDGASSTSRFSGLHGLALCNNGSVLVTVDPSSTRVCAVDIKTGQVTTLPITLPQQSNYGVETSIAAFESKAAGQVSFYMCRRHHTLNDDEIRLHVFKKKSDGAAFEFELIEDRSVFRDSVAIRHIACTKDGARIVVCGNDTVFELTMDGKTSPLSIQLDTDPPKFYMTPQNVCLSLDETAAIVAATVVDQSRTATADSYSPQLYFVRVPLQST